MKEIKLTQGKVALVDDADYEWLSQWKWAARRANSFLENWYAVRSPEMIAGKRGTAIKMHNQITGRKPGQTDHRDGNGLNNQRLNLRECGHIQNSFNRRKQNATSSRFKGVSWGISVNKWRACIQHNRHLIHLGYFQSDEEAAKRYDSEARRLFGEFAKLNFPLMLILCLFAVMSCGAQTNYLATYWANGSPAAPYTATLSFTYTTNVVESDNHQGCQYYAKDVMIWPVPSDYGPYIAPTERTWTTNVTECLVVTLRVNGEDRTLTQERVVSSRSYTERLESKWVPLTNKPNTK